ncbi:MAG TPA: LysM peptidoglycan-binding domain-containing protein [Spirillospora sp.]|nr:LysM peptidoglycan-binding domain-containing protein [Spirillospora sp.]
MTQRLAIFLFCFLSFKISFAVDFTTVSLPLLAMQQGQSGVVEAEIECLADGCSAFDITIQFEPQVIRVDTVELGPFLGAQVFTAENIVDNEAGLVQLAAAALGDLPSTEERVLLRLGVTALNPGTSQLRIVRLDVGDLIGNPLETERVDGGVVVTAATDETGEAPLEIVPTSEPEAAAQEPQATEPATCQYTIRSGDTLSGVAIANGVSVSQLMEMNNISDPRLIRVGEVLTVPASECRGAVTASNIIQVHDCRHLGNNLFEWYSVRRNYDANGRPISETRIGGPYTGEWRPGCPAGEQPQPPAPSRRRSQDRGGGGASGTPTPTAPPPFIIG